MSNRTLNGKSGSLSCIHVFSMYCNVIHTMIYAQRSTFCDTFHAGHYLCSWDFRRAFVINWRAAQMRFELQLRPREPLHSWEPGCHRLTHHFQTCYDLALSVLVLQLQHSYTGVIINWFYCHLRSQPTIPSQSLSSIPQSAETLRI